MRRMLAVEFTDLDTFAREFHENLSKGGIFVPTDRSFELRSLVQVEIELKFCDQEIVLEGEVVHCIPVELASAGATPGVAVQFDMSVKELRMAFAARVGEIPEPTATNPSDAERVEEDRRASPRETARVVAQVRDLEGARIDGMTRDLSTTGIQLSLTGEVPPVGTRVVVVLSNPNRGESLEIPSEVMRHVCSAAGEVVAVGIRFCPDDGCQEMTQMFLHRLRDHEHTRRLGGIAGEIEELGLASVLQSFATSSQEGTVTVIRAGQEGYIAFSDGCLVASRAGRLTGQLALARMLRWQEGRFEFHARIDPAIEREAPVHLEGAVLEALCAIDESRSGEASALSPESRFAIEDERWLEVNADLSKLECAVIDLVRVGANVRKLLDVIPESEQRVHDAIASLVELEVLIPNVDR